ncbi:hypothetical protein [Mucilaginibacter lappiensis]|uniref:Uncharacterized protein n=1 Tax=Mucilaginibacter lappiensis TaxID=354630 RepID=A0A841JKH2_9SPHI|nr:hypothetical protein [Mucilaginibacter lappiensis]MBB6131500.1 hypothetical protein [Mucilaginibacter lappiensis]
MTCLLFSRMGIAAHVQGYFAGSYRVTAAGDILFPYGDDSEVYSPSGHTCPETEALWIYGCELSQAKEIVLGWCAMEIIAFLNQRQGRFTALHTTCFIATGIHITEKKQIWIKDNLKGKKIHLLYPGTLIGAMIDIRVACLVANITLEVSFQDNLIHVVYQGVIFTITPERLSLHVLKKILRVKITARTWKQGRQITFLEQQKQINRGKRIRSVKNQGAPISRNSFTF